MNRDTWKALAEARVLDAESLLAAGRWPAAYYLVGYAVECGLKACVLAYVIANPEIIFINRRYSDQCWSHKPGELAALANLDVELNNTRAANPDFQRNWATINSWVEVSRYDLTANQAEAEKLFRAVTDQPDGVLPWIRGHW